MYYQLNNNNKFALCQGIKYKSRAQGIGHQHGNGHQANAAGQFQRGY
jgi:hypothetical protein